MFSPMDAVQKPLSPHSLGRFPQYSNTAIEKQSDLIRKRVPQAWVEIIEQPASVGARFRYKCEGRSAGCIRGVNSTEKQKTYPTIKVHGYQGNARVVVSCVTKDGPPYYPHPHNLVGKTCTNGVCYKSISDPSLVCSFANLGIQCVKKKDIRESLSQRAALKVDPFGTGFSHHSEPSKINLNALRLCFQVFIPAGEGNLPIPLQPVISNPIFDNKTVSDLTITKLSHYSAPVTGGQEVILLCDQVNKDDIQILLFEESNNKIIWSAQGKFAPHHVHRKAAIAFQTPSYHNIHIQQSVNCFIQLRRPSDGAVGKAQAFTLLPLRKDPEGMARKRSKFEALRLDKLLQVNNLSLESDAESTAVPRVIKQAVRSKVNYQNSTLNHFQHEFSSMKSNEPHSSAGMVRQENFCATSMPMQMYNQQQNLASSQDIIPSSVSASSQPCPSHPKVEDLVAIASEQIAMSNAQSYCETPSDDTFDKFSSLGLDNCDSDGNLSGIILEPLSGLSFSLTSMDVKNSA